MNETPKRAWWRDPLRWFAIVFVPLWIVLGVGWANGEALIDRFPVLSLGILDTILVFAIVSTVFWLVLALLLRCSGRTRLFGFAGLAVTMGVVFFVLPQFFEFDLDGDVRPLGLRLKQASGALAIEVEGEIAPLQQSSSSFTQFLGPNRDLSVPWLEISQDANAVDCPVLWRRAVGAGWSGFAAVDGLAFTLEQHGNREVVVAYRIADGKRIWIHEAVRRHFHPAGGTGPRSTPTFHDNRLYTLGAIGHLICLEANTGNVLWEHDLLKEFGIPVVVSNPDSDARTDVEQSNVMWGRAASPLIVGDLVVVPVGGATDGPQVTLAAFDRLTGELRWQGGKRAISYGSPTLVTLHGQPQIVMTTEEHVCGFDPNSGEELWSHSRSGRSNGDANTSQPLAVSDDQLLVTKEYGMGGELIKLNRSADGGWSIESLWRNARVLKTKFTVAAVRNEHAYAISSGILECVNWKTGEQVWRGERVRHGQMLVTRQHLVVMSEDGNLTVAAVDPDDYMPQFTIENVLSGR
ncbi:MAG: PQQ-binding-like beta-propeller repeat protein, partial [Pirellulaceae bacterium]|nr:PQQ-binding-like beta-propeller repeat protein [Pirellulaceae bacterium]